MSIFTAIIDFFEGKSAASPAAGQAASDLKTAEASVAAAVEPLADDLLNTVLEKVPVAGELLAAPADQILNSFIAKLLAKFPGLAVPAR